MEAAWRQPKQLNDSENSEPLFWQEGKQLNNTENLDSWGQERDEKESSQYGQASLGTETAEMVQGTGEH